MLLACLLLGLLVPAPALARQDPLIHRAIGVVQDAEGRPFPGAAVVVTATRAVVPDRLEPELVTDSDGRFEVLWESSGATYSVVLDIGGRGSCVTRRALSGGASEILWDLGTIRLAPAWPLELQLLDEANVALDEGWEVTVEVEVEAGVWRPAERGLRAGIFRIEDVPAGTFEVRVTRAGEPGPSTVTRVRHERETTPHPVRLESRRQVWVRIGVPWPDSMRVDGVLYAQLVVLAETADGEEIEALPVQAQRLFLFDDLPAGALQLRVEGPHQLRPYEAPLPDRGEVSVQLRGSLDLDVVLLEQGEAGPIANFDVRADVDVEVVQVAGFAGRRVRGLVPGLGGFELYVPGASRPSVHVDLSSLSEAELNAGRIVRTLPSWYALSGQLVDETDSGAEDGVLVEIFEVGEDDALTSLGPARDLDRGGNYRFDTLVPGLHLVRVWWAPRHWQDYRVQVPGPDGRHHVERDPPAVLRLIHTGVWPEEFDLVVHPVGAPLELPCAALRPGGDRRFEPLVLPPGEVRLAVARRGSGRRMEIENLTVSPGTQSSTIEASTLPALVRWAVELDGSRVEHACCGSIDPVEGTVQPKFLRMGTRGARQDCLIVSAGNFELFLLAEDGTWCARRGLNSLRGGEVRALDIEVARVRGRIGFTVDGEPLRNGEVLVEVATREGNLPQRTVRTDGDGCVEIVSMAGTMTVLGPGPDCEPVSFDWSESSLPGRRIVDLR